MLNSVVKISMMSAKYFEYYTIMLRGPFFRGHAVEALEQAIPPLRHVLPVSRYGSGSEKIKCKSV